MRAYYQRELNWHVATIGLRLLDRGMQGIGGPAVTTAPNIGCANPEAAN